LVPRELMRIKLCCTSSHSLERGNTLDSN
jgi:hypothetical protein